jgi:hypothetical protein
MDLYLTIFIALAIIPIISAICSRLTSLPIDLVSVGLSIIVIVVSRTSAFIETGAVMPNKSWPFLFAYMFLVSAILTAMSTSFYFFYSKSFKVEPVTGAQKLTIHIIVTFLLSTITSTLFMFVGYALALNAKEVFSQDYEGKGELVRIVLLMFPPEQMPFLIGAILVYPAVITFLQHKMRKA